MPILLFFFGFIFAEVYLISVLSDMSGALTLLWLAATVVGGLLLMRLARFALGQLLSLPGHLMHSPLSVLALGRIWISGFLLLLPGIISDILALVILLLPGRLFSARRCASPPPHPQEDSADSTQRSPRRRRGRGPTINAEFEEIDDER